MSGVVSPDRRGIRGPDLPRTSGCAAPSSATPLAFEPTQLFYLVSLRCNERCSKCSHWRVREHPAMVAVDFVVAAVHETPSIDELCIVGGEPLVHRERVAQIVEGLADTRVRTTIVTNGVLCTPDLVDRIGHLAVHFVFSIDTLDPERWNWVRGRATMPKVLRNLAYVRRALRPDQLSVQSVLSMETQRDVSQVGRWLARLGIHHSVQRYVQMGFDGSWTPIEAKCEGQLSPMISTGSSPCAAAGRNLSIMPDGSVFTCFQQPSIPGCARPLGRLGDQSIRMMLQSPYAASVVERMRKCELPCKVLKCNQPMA